MEVGQKERCIFEHIGRGNHCLALSVKVPNCGKSCKFFKSDKEYYLDYRGFAVKREKGER